MAEYEHNLPYPVVPPDHVRERRDRKCGMGFTIMDVIVSGVTQDHSWVKTYVRYLVPSMTNNTDLSIK